MIEYENLNRVNQPFFEKLQKKFLRFLESGWYILGNQVKSFEEEFRKYHNSKYCVGLASGLDALSLGLRAFQFEKGSEVIVPSNTYIATIISIYHNDLVPVLVEPDINTYNIDPRKIEEHITKKTRAIMPVHLYGKACDMKFIKEIAEKYDLKIIEDAAQAHGAMHLNSKVGSIGDVGAFSFYPTKNLGAFGDGGAILTNNDEIYEKVMMLRNYGEEVKYQNKLIGFNSRLDEIQAGFLSIKLKFLDEFNAHKRTLANLYHTGLNRSFILPTIDSDYFDVYHIFNIRHDKRDHLQQYLLKNEVKTSIHYPIPPHKQTALKEMFRGKYFPISEEIHRTTLSLPISIGHTEDEINQVIDILNKY